MTRKLKVLSAAAAAALVAGCAGMETNPALELARSEVARAESDSLVVESAQMRLERAREHLENAQSVWDDEGNSGAERVEHEAYLASRNAQIALTQADITRNEQAIDEAETARAQVLAEARAADADRAELEAARAQSLAATREQEAERAEALAATRAEEVERAEALAAVRERQAARAESRADELAEELEAERTDRGLVLTLGDVLFDTDGTELKAGAEDTVARVAEYLRTYSERRALIEGHTDDRGSEAYNQELSERRALAMRDALIDQGIDPARLVTRGMGEQAPIATNETAAGRQENRRVEIVISDEDGNIPGVSTGRPG